MTNDNSVKVLFRYHSSVLDKWTVETMWAEIIDADKGIYKLDNIPFYGPLVESDDIIFAEYDQDEQMLTNKKTIENSGNSIVTVIIMGKVNYVRDIFKKYDCHRKRLTMPIFQWRFLRHSKITKSTFVYPHVYPIK